MTIFSPRRFFSWRSRMRILLTGSLIWLYVRTNKEGRLGAGYLRTGWGLRLLVLVHVLDIGLIKQDVRLAVPIHLEAGLVIPFDHSPQLLAIPKHEYHGSFGLHLLHIIEILGIGLVRRNGLFLLRSARRSKLLFDFIEGWTDEFSISRLHNLPSFFCSVTSDR